MPSVTNTGTAGTQKHWFTDFGKWINYTGGRDNFIAWMAKLLTMGLGPDWTTHPPEDLVEFLFNHDQHGEQFSDVIQTETDLNELVTLINRAMSQTKPPDKRKRKPNNKRQEFELSHLSRCQRRNYLKREHRRHVHIAKQKRKRRLHVRVPTNYALPRKALYVLVPGTRGVWGPGTEQTTTQGKLKPLLQSLLIGNGMQLY